MFSIRKIPCNNGKRNNNTTENERVHVVNERDPPSIIMNDTKLVIPNNPKKTKLERGAFALLLLLSPTLFLLHQLIFTVEDAFLSFLSLLFLRFWRNNTNSQVNYECSICNVSSFFSFFFCSSHFGAIERTFWVFCPTNPNPNPSDSSSSQSAGTCTCTCTCTCCCCCSDKAASAKRRS